MKQSLMLLGAVSAHTPKFLSLADVQPQTINTGICQMNVGTYFFDLNPFESMGGGNQVATQVNADPNYLFAYKVCQAPYSIDDGTMEKNVCSGNALAFGGEKDGENFSCVDQFGQPSFLPIANDDESSDAAYKGFQLTYTAQYEASDEEKCAGGQPKTVVINAICNKNAESEVWSLTETHEACNVVYEFKGDTACKFYDVNISKYFSGLNKFMGAIAIILGLILCFVGSKFILIVFGLLCLMLSQIVPWLILYNTHMFNPE